MQDYMKETNNNISEFTTEEIIEKLTKKNGHSRNKSYKIIAALLVLMVGAGLMLAVTHSKIASINVDGENPVYLASAPIAVATTTKKDVIGIPAGIVKAHPFLPYRNISGDSSSAGLVNDVPKFDLIAPPELQDENSEASKVMDTIVSGILFDKYSPSAILNINGNDYLVKKGDTINNYKILAIARDSVTVQLGKNTFKAGIGEILSDGTVNYNEVSNLNKKFGGERR